MSLNTSNNNISAGDRIRQITEHIKASSSMTTNFDAAVVPQAPEDPLFGLMAAYRKDTDPRKVDLGIGAYRDDNAKPWVLPVVRAVSRMDAICARQAP
jgi:aspartate aminotransferase